MFVWRIFDLDVGARTGLGGVPGMSATLPRGMGLSNGTQPVMGFGKSTDLTDFHTNIPEGSECENCWERLCIVCCVCSRVSSVIDFVLVPG